NDVNELYASGTFRFPELKKFIFTKTNKPKILLGHDDPKQGHDDWTDQSDQGSFYAKKIPFIYFGVEDHKDYHKATDEFQNINQAFYVNSVQSILEIIKNFDKNYSLNTVHRETQIMN
ncbi:MAG: M28 family peptidase, partial [Bacteroidetes bacterium]|nr:M28 family peptidase [Bacteroidota bacterium]MBU1760442.1 M28 family peptidase [Bacteroidota bacterium]